MRVLKHQPRTARTLLGILLTDTPLRALNVSRTGCLLESHRYVEPGTAGKLQLEIEGRIYVGEVRVTRCQRMEGAATAYRLGVEFLRTQTASPGSLRRVVYSMLEKTSGVVGKGPLVLPGQDLESEA